MAHNRGERLASKATADLHTAIGSMERVIESLKTPGFPWSPAMVFVLHEHLDESVAALRNLTQGMEQT